MGTATIASVQCIANSQCVLGESPVWHPDRRSLFWIDIAPPSVLYEWDSQSARTRSQTVPFLACAMTMNRDGRLVLLSTDSLYLYDPDTGVFAEERTAQADRRPDPPMRFNDCGCDSRGRLWTGSMLNGFSDRYRSLDEDTLATPQGALYRYESDAGWTMADREIGCPNTFCWSPSEDVFYSADSSSGCIFAWDYDSQTGTASGRREFFARPGKDVPDGSAMDYSGNLWNARWGGACVLCISPQGELVGKVDIPARQVTSCAFGGDRRDALFVTTARFGMGRSEIAAQPLAGGVFMARLDTEGIEPQRFAGGR